MRITEGNKEKKEGRKGKSGGHDGGSSGEEEGVGRSLGREGNTVKKRKLPHGGGG